jgi:hypothetical protein
MIKSVHETSRKVPVIVVRFLWNLNSLEIFSKNTQTIRVNIKKIRPEGAELFNADGHRDGQTDTTKPKVALRNFANESKKLFNLDL